MPTLLRSGNVLFCVDNNKREGKQEVIEIFECEWLLLHSYCRDRGETGFLIPYIDQLTKVYGLRYTLGLLYLHSLPLTHKPVTLDDTDKYA